MEPPGLSRPFNVITADDLHTDRVTDTPHQHNGTISTPPPSWSRNGPVPPAIRPPTGPQSSAHRTAADSNESNGLTESHDHLLTSLGQPIRLTQQISAVSDTVAPATELPNAFSPATLPHFSPTHNAAVNQAHALAFTIQLQQGFSTSASTPSNQLSYQSVPTISTSVEDEPTEFPTPTTSSAQQSLLETVVGPVRDLSSSVSGTPSGCLSSVVPIPGTLSEPQSLGTLTEPLLYYGDREPPAADGQLSAVSSDHFSLLLPRDNSSRETRPVPRSAHAAPSPRRSFTPVTSHVPFVQDMSVGASPHSNLLSVSGPHAQVPRTSINISSNSLHLDDSIADHTSQSPSPTSM